MVSIITTTGTHCHDSSEGIGVTEKKCNNQIKKRTRKQHNRNVCLTLDFFRH
jgi:hypothetical protein